MHEGGCRTLAFPGSVVSAAAPDPRVKPEDDGMQVATYVCSC
jgi:hypothetical protein